MITICSDRRGLNHVTLSLLERCANFPGLQVEDFGLRLVGLVLLAVPSTIPAISGARRWSGPRGAIGQRLDRLADRPTVTKTVTVKVLVPGPAVTVTAPAPAPASAGVVCFTYGGRAYLTSPGAGVGPVSGRCTIAVTPVLPMSSGQAQIVVTAPDGETGTYITEP